MRSRAEVDQTIDFDMIFLLATIMLLVMGTIMIFSSSYFISKETSGSSFTMIRNHLLRLVIGIGMMAALIRFDYRKFNSRFFVLGLLGAGLICCVLCFAPGIGIEAGHARRWVRVFFFTVQASEVTKIALVFYLAYYLSKKSKNIDNFYYGIMPVFAVVCIATLLIFIEPDFGTATTIGMWSIIVLIIAGMRFKHLLIILVSVIPVAVLALILEPYRRARLMAFSDPWQDMQGVGYQIVQSMAAFANGGLFGSGLGEGTQKLFFLPAPHTDFIFSVLGEELGFVGVVFVVVLFGIWTWRGLSIALATNDSFGFFLAVSSVSLVALQAMINMGVSMSILPTTGITLPFFSYGGSSLIMVLIVSGLVLSISKGARI